MRQIWSDWNVFEREGYVRMTSILSGKIANSKLTIKLTAIVLQEKIRETFDPIIIARKST